MSSKERVLNFRTNGWKCCLGPQRESLGCRTRTAAPFFDANIYRFTLVMMYGVSTSRSG